ncbi:MAG: hypothetical protein ABIJ12_08245 [bacterium]
MENDEKLNEDLLEIKNKLLNDRAFKVEMLFDLLGLTMKTIGWVGAFFTILVIYFGYQSLGGIARDTMNDFLEAKGQEFERQFDRLSNIPSYVTYATNIIVNDSSNNFVQLPLFNDIKRRSTFEECECIISPIEYKGVSMEYTITPDSLNDIPGFRITSKNKIPVGGVGVGHSPGFPTREETPVSKARIFIFASRKLT